MKRTLRPRNMHRSEISPDELNCLLQRLHAPDHIPEQEEDHVTVAAVCELTGAAEDEVWDLLERIREEDIEARVVERLRELEEPLYRVERPGFVDDSLTRPLISNRRRILNSVLDQLPKPG